MAKKKFVENEDGSTEAVDVITDQKEKKEYRLKTKGQNIKAEKKKNHKDMFFMNYKDGMKLIKKMKKAGKKWSSCASENAPTRLTAISHIQRIVVAVGDVETASEPRVIADQLTFHTDVLINQVVFM
uniref:Uncharacterized protein n=1 Tax=Caenorhabditis japonica TaxID=281687 RepID=A0A8R1IL76_CAEJA